jgi:hypothetical protein
MVAATDTGNHTSYAMLKHVNILFAGEAYTRVMFFYSGLILTFENGTYRLFTVKPITFCKYKVFIENI